MKNTLEIFCYHNIFFKYNDLNWATCMIQMDFWLLQLRLMSSYNGGIHKSGQLISWVNPPLMGKLGQSNWKKFIAMLINAKKYSWSLHPLQEFLAVLKTLLWLGAASCPLVGFMSLWHIPNFHSQFFKV